MKEEKDKLLEEEDILLDDILETPESTSLIVKENKKSTTSFDEEIRRYEFLNRKKNDDLDLEKKRMDIRFYRIQKIVNLFVGVFLLFSSFLVYSYNPETQTAGAFLLGCSLAALGINTINFKSLINRNEEG